jgi:hypothetical protein
MRRTLVVVLAVAALGAPAALAHHSFAAAYRESEKVTIDGAVVQMVFRNPHSFLHVDAPDDKGVTRRWTIEWGAAAQLEQQGVKRGTLRPGDRVIVMADPSRNPTDYRLRMRTLERPADGFKYGATFD